MSQLVKLKANGIHVSWNLALAKPQLVRFARQTAPKVSKMLIQYVH